MASGAMILNALMNWWLMRTMGVAGIALATAGVNLFCSSVLAWYVASRIRAEEQNAAQG
jgi:Na+-driven multidrug efflux pump